MRLGKAILLINCNLWLRGLILSPPGPIQQPSLTISTSCLDFGDFGTAFGSSIVASYNATYLLEPVSGVLKSTLFILNRKRKRHIL